MNSNQYAFVTEYLRHRDKVLAYAKAYNLPDISNYRSIESAANRLLRHPEVAAEIQKTYEAIRYEVEQEIRKELKVQLLTIQRKRELLAQIATGEISVLQHYKNKTCSQCSLYIQPTISQMLAAIKEDSKLAGHYPPPARTAVSETGAYVNEVENQEQSLGKAALSIIPQILEEDEELIVADEISQQIATKEPQDNMILPLAKYTLSEIHNDLQHITARNDDYRGIGLTAPLHNCAHNKATG